MLRSRARTATLGVTKPPPPLEKEAAAAAAGDQATFKRFPSLMAEVSSPSQEEEPWEVRPGGMLVQKRGEGTGVAAPRPILVRVKYGPVYHQIRISPEASFGELKKMLSVETHLHPQEMKLLLKGKERNDSSFLDSCGVKDRSKLVVVEDPTGKARRLLEMRKNAKMEKASKTISLITSEVDKLARQVSQLEGVISREKKVAESDVLNLIEQLMDLLIKLDGIVADGEVKEQRGVQVRRVQKYVETLDLLKIKNSGISNVQPPPPPPPPQQQQQHKKYPFPYSNQQAVQHKLPQSTAIPTKRWEPFDLLSSMPTSASSSTSATTNSIPAMSATTAPAAPPRFNWELF